MKVTKIILTKMTHKKKERRLVENLEKSFRKKSRRNEANLGQVCLTKTYEHCTLFIEILVTDGRGIPRKRQGPQEGSC
jgi:hypothetical protein